MLALMLLFVVFITGLEAQTPYVLSQRVGSEIDSSEIAYFMLFPHVRKLHSARLTLENDSTIKMEGEKLIRGEFRDTILYVPLNHLQQVGAIVDKYEEFMQRASMTDFASIYPLIAPVLLPMKSVKFEVTLQDGTTYVNDLFSATDSGFYMWKSEKGFDWQNPSDNIQYISSDKIYRLQSPSYSSKFLVGGLVGGGVGLGLGTFVYSETESIISGLSTVAGLASLGVSVSSNGSGSFVIIDGSRSKYHDQIGTLYSAAATGKRIPPELAQSGWFEELTKPLSPPKHIDVNLLRTYSSFKPYSVEIGVQSSVTLNKKFKVPTRISGRDQVKNFSFHFPDALNIRFLWRPSRGLRFFAQTGALILVGEDSNDIAPFRELIGLGASLRIQTISKEETEDVAEIAFQPTVGLHLNHTNFSHDLGPYFSEPILYNDVLLWTSSISIVFESHLKLGKAIGVVNSIRPAFNLPLNEIPENVYVAQGGTGTWATFRPFRLDPYFSIGFGLGVLYRF